MSPAMAGCCVAAGGSPIGSDLRRDRCAGGCAAAHGTVSMLRQRVYGPELGYEDLNDHDELRRDPAIQTAVDRDADLAAGRGRREPRA